MPLKELVVSFKLAKPLNLPSPEYVSCVCIMISAPDRIPRSQCRHQPGSASPQLPTSALSPDTRLSSGQLSSQLPVSAASGPGATEAS